jgi:hypothetical protein
MFAKEDATNEAFAKEQAFLATQFFTQLSRQGPMGPGVPGAARSFPNMPPSPSKGGYKKTYEEYEESVTELCSHKGYTEADWLNMEKLREKTSGVRRLIETMARLQAKDARKTGNIRRRVRTRRDDQSESDLGAETLKA